MRNPTAPSATVLPPCTTAAASAGIYYFRGDVTPLIAAPVALGSVCGAFLGSRIMMRISGGLIRLLFIAVLLFLAVEMLLTALGKAPAGVF